MQTYMNSRFVKYLKMIRQQGTPGELIEQAKAELHKTFATLTQEEQKYANIFLHDTERGDVIPEPGKTLRDYITEYQYRAKNDQIHRCAEIFGLDEEKLRNLMKLGLNEKNIREFGRFDELKKTVDKSKAKAFLRKKKMQADSSESKYENRSVFTLLYYQRRLRSGKIYSCIDVLCQRAPLWKKWRNASNVK